MSKIIKGKKSFSKSIHARHTVCIVQSRMLYHTHVRKHTVLLVHFLLRLYSDIAQISNFIHTFANLEEQEKLIKTVIEQTNKKLMRLIGLTICTKIAEMMIF